MAKSPKSSSKTKPAASKKTSMRSKATTDRSIKRASVNADERCAVFGAVTYADARPAAGVTVIAYDKDESREDRLGQATTNAAGAYTISYSEASFRKTPKERGGADVIVRVYNDQNELLLTSKKKNSAPPEYQLNIQLPIQQYVVRGTVKDANGKPLPNMHVCASERDLRIPQQLGTDETDVNGDYRIDYHPDAFQLGDLLARRVPWLIVEVCASDEGEVLARQEIPKANPDQTVLFTLTNIGAVSEKHRCDEAVPPLLKGQGEPRSERGTHAGAGNTRGDLDPWDITPADVDFIVRDIELDRVAVEAWAASSRMTRDAGLRLTEEHATQQALLIEHGWTFFYAMARQGLAQELSGVLRESSAAWQSVWKSARALNRVPVLPEKQIELLVQTLELLTRLQQLDPQHGGDNPLAKVLAGLTAPLPKTIALDALQIVQEKGLDDPDALLQLVEHYPQANVAINSLVRGVRVYQLAPNAPSLFNKLSARLSDSTSDSIAPLAVMTSADWLDLAQDTATNGGQALRLLAHVEAQHPLSALQAKIISGNVTLPGVTAGEMATLVKNAGATVEKIVQGKMRVKDSDKDTPAVHKTLRDVGRFVRTGVSIELAADLMNAGIETPGTAIRYGREHIYEQYRERLSDEDAREVVDSFFDATEKTINGGKGVMLEVDINRRSPAWMFEELPLALPDDVRENLPSLPGLFGDLDECLCRPCESMLGQPAYLVDLLNLLGPNIHWLLKQKRPGIFTLPLDCENADPEKLIQHIEIVLEVLAAATANLGNNATQAEIEQAAYDKLAIAIFPWTLPFRLPYAETMAYLAKLNVSRLDLLALRSNPQANEIAAETLNLSFSPNWAISEWRLLTESRTDTHLWQAYGLDRLGVSGTGFPLFDPASGEDLSGKSREEVLTRVSVLIDIIGLGLDELEQAFKTEFVSGFQGGVTFTNRDQCKTSEMRLVIESEQGQPPLLEGCLDRLHRFTRLYRKLPGWSIPQLGNAIRACNGIEVVTPPTTPQERENTLIRLAIIKRLHDQYGMPLEFLHDRAISEGSVRKMLGLSAMQFVLLTTLTGINPTVVTAQPFNWVAVEEFCKAVTRIRESGLSIEQVAHALMTRDQLKSSRLFGELPPTIKTDKQIEDLLGNVQQRLRSVVATRPDVTLESQANEALSEIYDAATADKLVNAIRDTGAEQPAEHVDLLPTLYGNAGSRASRKLGEWLPLLTESQAEDVITLASNLSIARRFEVLLNGIALRRRERTLIAAISEQCGLAESEVIPLLGSRLLLDPPPQSQPAQAAWAFLDEKFWADIPPPTITIPPTPPTMPGVSQADMPRLHAWMDRLYRLIALNTALQIDGELMLLADRVTVGNATGISWRDILATPPATGSAWDNPHWQALLDLVWLQQPEQLSRQALSELLTRLETRGTNLVQAQTLRPLATRLGIPEAQTLDIAAQAVGALNAQTLRNPTQLRRAFELLLLARRLGANDTQLTYLANPGDIVQTATTAKSLLEARIGGQENEQAWQALNDKLRQQRRDALVAYLVGNVRLDTRQYKKFNNTNDLYEYYLIDPQMEPCFETTRIVEAISATQLFAQRLLFGLEAGQVASKELKERWTWMRNYRVWEANRKVFLFPENWLFPELRDDKSSSFKQLESALGQGELTQDLANQAFGQFLDDVAQMGQVQVLGMYEDVAHDDYGYIPQDPHGIPERRTLYVIGRTPNPPYAYFWRHCVDFGSPYMEWSPWQRIELDIQGDHVLPFILGGQLYIAWPVIRSIKIGPEGATKDGWEVKLAWSRHDGKSWRKSSVSRDPWTGEAAAFSDERRGFSFRGETALEDSKATIFVYAIVDDTGAIREIEPTPADVKINPIEWDDATKNPIYAANETSARDFLTTLVADDGNFIALPERTKKQIRIYELIRLNWHSGNQWSTLHGMLKPNAAFGGRWSVFLYPDKTDPINPQFASNTSEEYEAWKPAGANLNNLPSKHYREKFVDDFVSTARLRVDSPPQEDFKYFNYFYGTLERISSRRTVICKAWIKLKAPDGNNPIAYMPLTGAASEGNYMCRVGTETIPFNPGVPYPMVWKLGDQPEVHCTLSLSPRVRPASTTILEAPLGTIYTLGSVDKGYEATQTVHFVIDGTMHNAIDIGFDLDAYKTLKMVGQFTLTRDDMVSQLPTRTPQNPIYNPVNVSRPWMNGFREISTREDANPRSPLQIAYYSGAPTPIFESTEPLQFWVVGAATWRGLNSSDNYIPMAWHYSESGRSGYIDLGYRLRLADSGILVYPDSYPEATIRRSNWSQRQTLPVAENQKSDFGATKLPMPEISSSVSWIDIRDGKYTYDPRLPYACYNWEVFFHAPLLIADQLSKQHKFEDAERWLRYVFDPTSSETDPDSKRFLKFRVFKELNLNQQVIDDLTALAQAAGDFATDADIAAIKKLINRWRDAPFRPFLIARRRHIAFLWRTLFAYLDNLIAWADSLYRRDTRESINEATMLYVLAERILGRRPQLQQGKSKRDSVTYEDTMTKWDDFANYWIDAGMQGRSNRPTGWRVKDSIKQPNPDGMLYFCMPFNDKILAYWNTVDARLSNIRNCRNIEGIQRSLPLMDAPIDPELLIRATAAGLDLGDVIAGLYAPPPHYRYSILSARASELTNECKSLGAAMLSAIEKRDAEYLAQLRSSNEISLLKLVRDVRALQISEAERNIEALRASRRTISARYAQYQRLLGKKEIKTLKENESAGEESMLGSVDSALASSRSSLGLLKEEDEQYVGFIEASGWSMAAGIAKTASGVAHLAAAPAFASIITEGGAKVSTAVAHGLTAAGEAFSTVSQGWRSYAEQQGMMAGHIRRRDEWAFQSNQTLKELQQIDKQILANQIRIDITQKELNNHSEQIEQAKAVDEVMRSKFSNVQLYEWMKTELSRLYFNAYRMAVDMARRAERAAARELGVKPLNILRNDYWDSLRDGLLAGERLHQDLKRLEIAYLDQNRREFELTKHISLRRLKPEALVQLRSKAAGCTCKFKIPEWLFDLDTPGHYLRRIKSVSVSIPSVTGPYTSINCKLTLLNSEIRHANTGSTGAEYVRASEGDDPRFTDYFGATEAIVTSTGSADSGMFETQLRDERFLPFEGSGVISTWRLELPDAYPQFDYSTISDVVLSIRYTAREGGDVLRSSATASIVELLNPSSPSTDEPLLFSVVLSSRSDFPTEWARAKAGHQANLEISITRSLLPYWMEAAWFGSGSNMKQLQILNVSIADLSISPQSPPSMSEFVGVSPPAMGDVWTLGTVPNDTADRFVLLSVGLSG